MTTTTSTPVAGRRPAASTPTNRRLAGRTAIITGAPRSIGRAIARALAAGGARVVVHHRSRPDEARATVADLQAAGEEAFAVGGDLTDSSAVGALFSAACERFGGVDIVVANAGRTSPVLPVAQIDDALFDTMLDANTRATFYVLREAARTVRDGGRIINISSSSVHFTPAGYAAYSTSKAGALTTTAILAHELGGRGITANSIMAGPIAAGFLDPAGAIVAGAPAGALDALAAAAPAGRLGRPEDIAGLAAFLAGPEAGWINGQTILANNGALV